MTGTSYPYFNIVMIHYDWLCSLMPYIIAFAIESLKCASTKYRIQFSNRVSLFSISRCDKWICRACFSENMSGKNSLSAKCNWSYGFICEEDFCIYVCFRPYNNVGTKIYCFSSSWMATTLASDRAYMILRQVNHKITTKFCAFVGIYRFILQ